MSERAAFWITDILSDPDAREFVFGRGGSLDFPFPVAVKTGTSEGYRDNWTVGYTREVTVGVWVGNFDRAPLRNSSGVTGAGPIFHGVMLAAERRVAGHIDSQVALAEAPSNVVRREICALSGMLANPWCPTKTSEWLPSDAAQLPCSWHHESDDGLLTLWPAVYRQWAAEHGLTHDGARGVNGGGLQAVLTSPTADFASPAKAGRHIQNEAHFSIANPPAGAIYLIDPTLRSQYQALPLRAAADAHAGLIEWAIDGTRFGASRADEPLQWPLAAGAHRIGARDQVGRVAEVSILEK
jgi:penicillin-binding protein 1C